MQAQREIKVPNVATLIPLNVLERFRDVVYTRGDLLTDAVAEAYQLYIEKYKDEIVQRKGRS